MNFKSLMDKICSLSYRSLLLSKTRFFYSTIQDGILKNHRTIGQEQQLFMVHPTSPGNAFMLTHGMRIVNTLINYLKNEYRIEGYHEVSTPLLYNRELWMKSGHWEKYKEDMFCVSSLSESEDTNEMGLKPMNCPGHCLVYQNTLRSYKDLPIRVAEFSPLHRNELSGALTGLTRLRRFHQDDAHIFCTMDQIGEEVNNCLSFIARVYKKLGFSYTFALATRPEKFIGDVKEWDAAESILKMCLQKHVASFVIKDKDGAFYGPKIDATLSDASGKAHQTATVQLDFQLPQRFDLKYQDKDGNKGQPVMIHRAIFGSVERMMAILMEHLQGKWPFWLSPRQIMICTVNEGVAEYAKTAYKQLCSEGYYVDLNLSSHDTLSKKVRDAQLEQYNYVLIVGDKEKDLGTFNIRQRDGKILGEYSMEQLLALFRDQSNQDIC